MNKETYSTELAVAIGYEISKLIPMKFGKDGRTMTNRGSRSIEGLGNTVLSIIQEQKERLSQYI